MNREFESKVLLARAFQQNDWIFAKTMPENPHEYALRKKWNSQILDFDRAVMLIRSMGYKERFRKTIYTQININGYFYWTMGAPVEKTILINRKPMSYLTKYDKIAASYDSIFNDPESHSEDIELIEIIKEETANLIGGKILDVGCGTGLLLDYIESKRYIGIDNSSEMLSVLKRKHPARRDSVINCSFEDYFEKDFDCIFMLYGVASYVSDESLIKIRKMLSLNGIAFCMTFKDNYFPKTYSASGITAGYNPGENRIGLVRKRISFRNYIISIMGSQDEIL